MSSTRLRRLLREAIAARRSDRRRTVLMLTASAAGTAVLALVLALSLGARARVMELVAKHGLDLLMVRAGGEAQVFAPRSDRGLSVLFEADARALEAEVPGIRLVSAVQNQRGITVSHEDRSVVTRAFGVEADWMEIRRWGVAEGEFLTAADLASLSRVVLLGARVARELFPEGNAVGRTVRVNGDPYQVKGIFIAMGASAGGDDWDDRIVVPFTTSARRLLNRASLEQIVIRVANASRLTPTAERVREVLRERHRIGPGEADDFFVREPEDVEGAAVQAAGTLSRLGLGLGITALLAGGLVIGSLMLAAISRRTSEFGLRRAAGARAADIGGQILFETLLVSLLGALAGSVVAAGAALGLDSLGVGARVTGTTLLGPVLLAVLIGVAAGLLPARRAARLDPAAAMRRHAG